MRTTSLLTTALLLVAMATASTGDQLTGGREGWKDIEGCRLLPLRALEMYCDGSSNTDDAGRIACNFAGAEFKVRPGSANILIGGQVQQLESKTVQSSGLVYVSQSIAHKLGWTCTPTPSGFKLHQPKSKSQLVIRRRNWKIEPHDAGAERRVGVWYIQFFTGGDEFKHWAFIDTKTRAMPVGGKYAPNDPKVIARQWREMRECGIDFVLMDDTNTMWVDNGLIDTNIRAWYDWMDKLPEEEQIKIAIAAGGELNQHSSRAGWTQAVNYLWDTFAKRPSQLTADGKPVLHWYIENDVWNDWTDPRWTIRRTYHFFRTGDQLRYGGWGYGSDEHPKDLQECISFHPGWDLSPPGHVREGGDFYRRAWINVLKRNPDHVLISDWNGFNEGTAIEDSDFWKDNYGDPAPSWYRLLTQGYVAAYKGELLDGFYYLEEGTAPVYQWTDGRFVHQGAYPHKIPVIVVPQGFLKKLSGQQPPAPG